MELRSKASGLSKVPEFGPPTFGDNEKPREESPGEAQIRLSLWLVTLMGLLRIRYYPFEQEALAKAIGPWIRRWPSLAEWEKPKKP